MKIRIYFLLVLALFLFSCTSRENIQLIEKAEKSMDISPDSALKILHTIKNPERLSKYYRMKYVVLNVLSKYKAYQDIKQDTIVFKATEYFNGKSNSNDKALANYAAASVMNENEKYTEAMGYYKNAEKVLDNSDYFLLKGIIYNSIAFLYHKQLMFGEAIKNYNMALREFSKVPNSQTKQINNLMFLGTEYLIIRELNKALYCYRKAYSFSVEINDIINQSLILNNIGLVYQQKKEYRQAINYFNNAVKLNIPDKEQVYKMKLNLASNYLLIHKIDSAEIYINTLTNSLEIVSNLNYKVSVVTFLKDYYRKKGNDRKSLFFSDINNELQIKLFEQNQSKALLEAEKKFDYTYAENKRQEAETKNSLLIRTIALLILTLVVFVLLFVLYRVRMKNNLLRKETEKNQLQTEKQQQTWSEYFYSFIAIGNKEIMNTIYKLSINSLIKDDEKLSRLLEQTNKEFQDNLSSQRKRLLGTTQFYEITGVDNEDAQLLNDNEKLLLSLLCCKLSREQISVMLNTTTESIRVRTIKLVQKLKEKSIKSFYKFDIQ